MKSLEWTGPSPLAPSPTDLRYGIEGPSISEAMDRLHHAKHAKFQAWQAAITMNMIFGDNYVTVPEIPKGYEDYAKRWHDAEMKAIL